MKASLLLKKIKNNIKNYPIEHLRKNTDESIFNKDLELIRPKDILIQMATFNSNNYDEILSLELKEDFEIDDNKIKDIKEKIDYYFSVYAPNDKIYGDFVGNISLYLALIVKKPFHPIGMRFTQGYSVFYKNGKYYCSGKTKFLKEKNSLCKYCVCNE